MIGKIFNILDLGKRSNTTVVIFLGELNETA